MDPRHDDDEYARATAHLDVAATDAVDLLDANADATTDAGAPWHIPWVLPRRDLRTAIRDDLAVLVAHALDGTFGEAGVRVVAGDPPPGATRAGPYAWLDWHAPPRDDDTTWADAVGDAVAAHVHRHATAAVARHVAWYGTAEHAAATAAWTRAVARAVAHAADDLGLFDGEAFRARPNVDVDRDAGAARHVIDQVHAATRTHAPRGWAPGPDPLRPAHAVLDAPATGLLVACAPHAHVVADVATRTDPALLGRLAVADVDPAHVVAAARDHDAAADVLAALAAVAHLR